MSELAYETFTEFRDEFDELLAEVKAAREDSYQGIPRLEDEPETLYHIENILERGRDRFDGILDGMSPEDCDVSKGAAAADSAMHFYSNAADWFTITEDDDLAEPLPNGVSNVGPYLNEKYQSGVKEFYDANLSL